MLQTTNAASCPPLLEVHSKVAGNDGDKLVGKIADAEMATALSDLLQVVKVAMPPDLFSIDPRVLKARRLLAELRQVSDSRPPSVVRAASTSDVVDLAFADTPLDLLTAEPEAQWDITLGLDRFMVSGFAPADRRLAVEQIVREWLTSNGYLELPPDDPH